jgi:hypothetical protein
MKKGKLLRDVLFGNFSLRSVCEAGKNAPLFTTYIHTIHARMHSVDAQTNTG